MPDVIPPRPSVEEILVSHPDEPDVQALGGYLKALEKAAGGPFGLLVAASAEEGTPIGTLIVEGEEP